MAVSPAREAAFRILCRVEDDHAFSTELLHRQPLIERLSDKDRALTSELVLGSLRWQGELDRLIEKGARRPAARLDLEVLVALRLGAYQLRHLDRIPARAAVDESVELVKQARKHSAAGFVNGVLRNLPAPPARNVSCEWAHPAWLVERWRRAYGGKSTAALLRVNLEPAKTYLRLSPRWDLADTLQLLNAEGVETQATPDPLCRRVCQGRPADTFCLAEGRVRIQDIGSQAVAAFLEVQSSHTFLDVCAAPGGKTHQVIDARGSAGGVVALDRHLHRLRSLARPGTEAPAMVVADATLPLPLRTGFDRILVDAPCSGTGTLARNPEIKWRLRPEDLPLLASKQKEILSRALDHLAPAGVLVYSTCSLEPEENRAVVDAVLASKTRFAARAYLERVPGRDEGDGFFACRITHRDGAHGAA